MARTTLSWASRFRRFTDHKEGNRYVVLAADHKAVRLGQSLYRPRVQHPDLVEHIFKSGGHSRKIGTKCLKGTWRGMPIFTLTLEERKTCPRTCMHWADCYGNKMNWSTRIEHGRALEERIVHELIEMHHQFPAGFIIRLHVLGDFYSVGYVEMWGRALGLLSSLRIFGYTAWHPGTPIGNAIREVRAKYPETFAMRFSDGRPGYGMVTETVLRSDQKSDAIVCPAQTGKTDCCGTCALCWSTPKVIAFIQH